MQKITPFLWFNDNAEEAVNFYVSIFKNSKVGSFTRYGDAGPGPKGSVMTAEFQLEGQPDAKDKLRTAFAAAKVTADVEVYPDAPHGWCMPDIATTYRQADAERAWAKLLALYKTALA